VNYHSFGPRENAGEKALIHTKIEKGEARRKREETTETESLMLALIIKGERERQRLNG